ncbi:MarR family winged helix-turn-helix transcriptional regulator, partial [Neoroseomonas rubea]|uniref:MarR family winged helix-turn-helix transcriptional regulator n=1 Tax=Neoroseomonas rubea TaxID=2748666 RepID=UPI0018DF9AC4
MSSEPDFDLDGFLPYRLSVASNRVSRLFARRYADEFGLSIPEWRVLAVVGADGTATARAVRDRTGMDKAKVSRAVAALLARRLLRHAPHRGDRRLEPLVLSAAGRRVFDAIVPRARALEAELTATLAPEARAALEGALAL